MNLHKMAKHKAQLDCTIIDCFKNGLIMLFSLPKVEILISSKKVL